MARPGRRSAPPCPRSTGSSAGRCPRSARSTAARGAGWRGSARATAAVVAVMWQAHLRRRDPLGEDRRRAAAARRPAAARSAAQSMVRPSRRGGVPVFSRPSRRPRPREGLATGRGPGARRSGRPGSARSPMWIRPRRKVPVVRTTAAARDAARRRPVTTPVTAAARDRSPDPRRRRPGCVRFGLAGEQRLHRLAVELAVGLGAGAADGRALAAVEHPELDAGAVDGPGHEPVEGVDLADQLALGEAADGRVAGHLADGVEVVGDAAACGRPGAPTPPRPRSRRGRRRRRSRRSGSWRGH